MAEQPVFWLGGKPGTAKAAEAPRKAEQFAAPIRAACEAHGLRVEEFVAALGAYDSWLVQFVRDDRKHRIIWNARDQRLSLDRALPSGGWEELRACPVDNQDVTGFVAGTRSLLSADSAKSA